MKTFAPSAVLSLTVAAALGAGVLMLAGCGNSNPTSSTATATPTPTPVTVLLKQGGLPGLNPDFVGGVTFTTSSFGTISGTVDWTFPSNEVWIALVAGKDTCITSDNLFDPSQCTFIASDNTAGLKPKRFSVPSQAAGTYTLYFRNRGPAAESLSFQIFLTS
jgi:hypothetical protein